VRVALRNFASRTAALAALIACTSLSATEAGPFNQFVGFGDSSIDTGWYFTHRYNTNPAIQALYNTALANGGGVATTPGGTINSAILASLFGLTAIPVGEPGGSNYAAGGATNVAYAGSTTLAPMTTGQIQSYLTNVNGAANPNALYMISSGGNDILDAICPGGNCVANATQLATTSANALSAAIAQLHGAGGRTFIVSILYNADPGSVGTGTSPLASAERTYNQMLYADLAAAGVNFIPVSGKVIATAIGTDPALFGLTNVMPGSNVTHQGGACINPNPALVTSAWAAFCTTLVAPNAGQTYLFADNLHYSAAGQLVEGDYAYSLVVAPTEMSYLAEAPVETRTAVVRSIRDQIQISQHSRSVGSYNGWISGDLSALSMGNNMPGFPTDPGTPGMVTMGVDYQLTSHWLIGAAASVGTTTQSFSLGGNFVQNEYALSGFAAYTGGPVWFDLIGSYGGLHDNTDRIVPIGVTTVANTGSTGGNNASFAAEAGYNLLLPHAAGESGITHGPVAGILLQRVYVDGFNESDPFTAVGGFTALNYAGQLRNSAVSELGYQASTVLGIWRPYAKLVWDHEFASANRVVTAIEPEVPFAPAFAMPAVIFGKDWATGTLGTAVALGRGVTGYASLSGEVGQSRVTSYGGQLGLNFAFADSRSLSPPR
jgi:outer membrane lipase/esterase